MSTLHDEKRDLELTIAALDDELRYLDAELAPFWSAWKANTNDIATTHHWTTDSDYADGFVVTGLVLTAESIKTRVGLMAERDRLAVLYGPTRSRRTDVNRALRTAIKTLNRVHDLIAKAAEKASRPSSKSTSDARQGSLL